MPAGQSASLPTLAQTVFFPGRGASRSSSRGEGASGLSFCGCAPSFSSLFFRFSMLVSQGVVQKEGSTVATPAVQGGVSRGGCAASPCSGEVPPRLRKGSGTEELGGADPSTVLLFRYPSSVFGTQLGIALFIGMFWDFRSPPAITSGK